MTAYDCSKLAVTILLKNFFKISLFCPNPYRRQYAFCGNQISIEFMYYYQSIQCEWK